jgi:hypothetical protein
MILLRSRSGSLAMFAAIPADDHKTIGSINVGSSSGARNLSHFICPLVNQPFAVVAWQKLLVAVIACWRYA